jgi:HEAT repeat protein
MIRSQIVRMCVWTLIGFTLVPAHSAGAQTDQVPNIRDLMAQLSDVRTTSPDVARQVLLVVKKDASSRDYVVQRLPNLIKGPDSDVWINAVHLAGQMKALEAIPSLQKAMSRRPIPSQSYSSAAMESNLGGDIVAKALSQMGDGAVPFVEDLLENGDELMRDRCVAILTNINTPASRKALREWLPHETEPSLKDLIRSALHR